MVIEPTTLSKADYQSQSSTAVAAQSYQNGRAYSSITPLKACLLGAVALAALSPQVSAYPLKYGSQFFENQCTPVTTCYPGIFYGETCITEQVCQFVKCTMVENCFGKNAWGDDLCQAEKVCVDYNYDYFTSDYYT